MITPLQLPAVVTTSVCVTVSDPVGVQLSLADAPASALNPAIVVAAAGRSFAHSRSDVFGASTVGAVLSVTVNTWSTDLLLLQASVIV